MTHRYHGGDSVLVNGAVFKTVRGSVRAFPGRFDSYTPPPNFRYEICLKETVIVAGNRHEIIFIIPE